MAKRFVANETSYHGYGAIKEIVHEVKQRGFQKGLIITDADLVKYQVVDSVCTLLDAHDCAYQIFDQVEANPSVATVKKGVAMGLASGADYLLAIGGGSPQDAAKAIGIIMRNPEYADVVSLEGVAATKHKSMPLIAVATTAGTAAEATINYVLTDEKKKRKFVCVDVHDIPIVAIVDPALMRSMPKGLSAATGMDALTHAIEGYTTLGAWELPDTLNIKAVEIIARNLRNAVQDEREARAAMALGQYMTGMAFSNVGLGLVHGMAHPLSAFYDTPHGVANAVLLPYVMEYNKDYTDVKYRDIAKAMGVCVDRMTQQEYRNAAIHEVKRLADDVEIPKTLAEIGVKEEDLPALAKAAMEDVCTGGNPRPCTYEDVLAIFTKAYTS